MATDYVVKFTGQDNLSGTIEGIRHKLQETGEATTKIDQLSQKFKKIENSTAPLKRRLRDLKTLMAQMNLDGLSNTDLFNQMAQQAGTYADAISDASTATKVFANDNFKLEAMAQGLQGIAGAASVATGVMGLLGKENEDVAKAIMKVQSVLAVLNGVQAVANVLNKDSALMLRLKQIRQTASTAATVKDTVATTANTVAIGANTAATVVNTTAQKAWNVAKAVAKALLGDWTGLVLVGAVALGTYALATDKSTDELGKQKKAIDSVKEAQNKYNSDVASSAGQLVGKYRLLQNAWNNLKTSGEKTQWIKNNATEFRNLGLRVNDLKSAEDAFVSNTNNVVTALEARAQAIAAQNLKIDAYTKYYEKVIAADNSVAGGGYYKKYKKNDKWQNGVPEITDEMKAAGVTIEDFEIRNKKGPKLVHSTEWRETQAVEDKMNKKSQKEAQERNKQKKKEAEEELNKTVKPANAIIDKANKTIQANGLNFNQGSGNSSGHSSAAKDIPTALTYEADSIADLEAQYKELEDELKNTNVSPERLKQINQEKAALIEQIEALKIRNGLLEPKAVASPEQQKRDAYKDAQKEIGQVEDDLKMGIILDVSTAEKQIKEINDKLVELGLTPIPVKLTPTDVEKKRQARQDAEQQVQQIQTDYKLKIIDQDQAREQLEAINAELQKLGLEPIQLYVTSEGLQTAEEAVETLKRDMEDVSSTIGSFGDAFNSLSGAVGGTAGEFLNLAGTIAQGIAQLIPKIVALIGVEQADSITKGVESAAGIGFPQCLPAIAAVVATITGIFASIAGKFADGGIVSGGTFHGDRLLARVNAGEMILNSSQQSKLFRMINNGGGAGGTASVQFKISGSNLVGVLNNYNSKMNKIR